MIIFITYVKVPFTYHPLNKQKLPLPFSIGRTVPSPFSLPPHLSEVITVLILFFLLPCFSYPICT